LGNVLVVNHAADLSLRSERMQNSIVQGVGVGKVIPRRTAFNKEHNQETPNEGPIAAQQEEGYGSSKEHDGVQRRSSLGSPLLKVLDDITQVLVDDTDGNSLLSSIAVGVHGTVQLLVAISSLVVKDSLNVHQFRKQRELLAVRQDVVSQDLLRLKSQLSGINTHILLANSALLDRNRLVIQQLLVKDGRNSVYTSTLIILISVTRGAFAVVINGRPGGRLILASTLVRYTASIVALTAQVAERSLSDFALVDFLDANNTACSGNVSIFVANNVSNSVIIAEDNLTTKLRRRTDALKERSILVVKDFESGLVKDSEQINLEAISSVQFDGRLLGVAAFSSAGASNILESLLAAAAVTLGRREVVADGIGVAIISDQALIDINALGAEVAFRVSIILAVLIAILADAFPERLSIKAILSNNVAIVKRTTVDVNVNTLVDVHALISNAVVSLIARADKLTILSRSALSAVAVRNDTAFSQLSIGALVDGNARGQGIVFATLLLLKIGLASTEEIGDTILAISVGNLLARIGRYLDAFVDITTIVGARVDVSINALALVERMLRDRTARASTIDGTQAWLFGFADIRRQYHNSTFGASQDLLRVIYMMQVVSDGISSRESLTQFVLQIKGDNELIWGISSNCPSRFGKLVGIVHFNKSRTVQFDLWLCLGCFLNFFDYNINTII